MNTEKLLESTLQKVLSSSVDPRTVLDGVVVPDVTTSSLQVFGIDRTTLSSHGLDKTAQDRVYKVLYIQSDGFFNFLKDITQEQARQSIWRVFLRLTENNFKGISAVDSVLRKQYEDTLHSLLAEHDATMRTSQLELEEAQRQLTETALKEAESRHQALLDKKLTQARTMQLEEQNAALIIELEQERLNVANHEREIAQLKDAVETQKSTILQLEKGTETFNKVSEDLISVTAAWTRLNEENQKLESEHSRMKGERDRVVQMTGGEIKKGESLASQVETSQAKVASLTKDLAEKSKSFNLLKNEHTALASQLAHVLDLFRKTHEVSNLHDQAFQKLFQVIEGAVDRKIAHHGTLLSSADPPSDVVAWTSSVHVAFSSIPRGRFVEQATSVWERLCSTLNELQQTNDLLALAQRRSASAEYIGSHVWQRSVVRLKGLVCDLRAESKKSVSEMERALGALHTVQESLKEVHKGKDKAEQMAAELALLKMELEKSRHDCKAFQLDLFERGTVVDKQAELIAKLMEDLALAQAEIASLKTARTTLAEIERKQRVDLERKTRDLDAINMSNTQLSSVFTALNSELSSLAENVLGTVAAVESGHIISADVSTNTKPSNNSLRSCSAAIEEDDSLLPQEKACIQAVIGFTLTLQKEFKRVSVIAQQTNKLKAEAIAAVNELQKLKAWTGRERQRLHSDFEHKLLEAEGLSQQKDLLAEQLQRDRKDLLNQITDLRVVNNSGLQKMEQLIAQLRALELEEVNRIIDPPVEPETVEEEKKEDDGVDWGFDQQEEESRPAEYSTFDSTFPSKPTAPKPTQKSPLEQLRL